MYGSFQFKSNSALENNDTIKFLSQFRLQGCKVGTDFGSTRKGQKGSEETRKKGRTRSAKGLYYDEKKNTHLENPC